MIYYFLITLLINITTSYTSHNCFNGCKTCQIYYIYIFCTHCDSDRIYNSYTGYCDCLPGYYDNGYCAPCPNSCLTCNSGGCLSCRNDRYLNQLSLCVCNPGKSQDSNGNCVISSSSINIGLILGITVGVSLGLSCIFTIIYIVRQRKMRIYGRTQQIAQHPIQLNPVIIEIRRIQQQSACDTFIDNKLQKKHYEFKIETCSICLDQLPYFMTQCGHYFHENCINQWVKKRSYCPNCNHKISSSKIYKWCNNCKKQLIYPQKVRIISALKQINKQDMPLFWPTCSHCQAIYEFIDLKQIK